MRGCNRSIDLGFGKKQEYIVFYCNREDKVIRCLLLEVVVWEMKKCMMKIYLKRQIHMHL